MINWSFFMCINKNTMNYYGINNFFLQKMTFYNQKLLIILYNILKTVFLVRGIYEEILYEYNKRSNRSNGS